MTWEQFAGWLAFAAKEPFGEERADYRAAANTLWPNDGINLIWPYIPAADEMWEKHQELERKQKELGPEHEAKLKAARQRYWEEKRKREAGQ